MRVDGLEALDDSLLHSEIYDIKEFRQSIRQVEIKETLQDIRVSRTLNYTTSFYIIKSIADLEAKTITTISHTDAGVYTDIEGQKSESDSILSI